jgi:phosphoglycolate phosphatase-like HAD superfamily hydrolase
MKYSPDLSDIRAVFFDFDDTLVGTFAAKSRMHIYVAKQHFDIDITEDDVKEHWGIPLLELRKTLYRTADGDRATKVCRACEMDFPKQLFPETKTALGVLASKYPLGLVTATDRYQITGELQDLDLAGYFAYAQTHDESEFAKPHPRVFDPALQFLGGKGISAVQALYIGDGLHDAAAAVGAGMQFIGVETGLIGRDDFAAAGYVSITNVGQLPDLLSSSTGKTTGAKMEAVV